MGSPHLEQIRSVRWLISSRLASEARAVFESSPFFGMSDETPFACLHLSGLLEPVAYRAFFSQWRKSILTTSIAPDHYSIFVKDPNPKAQGIPNSSGECAAKKTENQLPGSLFY